jgi:CRISPR/Cas system type I-B associated protein Csh2 (Cas7 group RAMP superfamily)
MNTTLDLFEAATVSLTRSTPIKERLADAYLNYLAYVHENDLPADVCEEFRALTDTLTRVSPQLRGDDALRATVRKMSTDDAAAAASAVVRMFGAVSRASASTSQSGVEEPAATKGITNVVPLHLAKA